MLSHCVSVGKAPADLKDNILSCYLNMHTTPFLKYLSFSLKQSFLLRSCHKNLYQGSETPPALHQQPKKAAREELSSAEGHDEQVRASPHYV